jgi:asparagine synthase (glutamine-hydrolysing)
MDWHALSEYLYYGNPLGRHTFYERIRRLAAGEYLIADHEGHRTAAYWRVEDVSPVGDSVEQVTQRVCELMDRAVKRHLISDVPVGVFLSGGVDSTAVTALATRHYGGRLNTYSVGFDFERGINELPKARRVAERYGTDHHELQIVGKNMSDHIEQLVRSHDEPFAEPANLPLLLLCEALKGSVKVVLQGDGGDEIFAGYRRYNVLAFERFWRVASRPAMAAASVFLRGPTYYRATRFFRAMNDPDPAMRMALMLTEEPYGDPPTRVLSTDALRRVSAFDPFERYKEFYARLQHLDPVQRMLYADSQILLTDTFLEKVDRSTMAHSIEVRVPFLDSEMTEYVMGLPSAMKVKRGQKKWVLRRAMRGIVPDDILDGPKTGFGVPFKYWLRGPLAEYMKSVLLDPSVRAWGLFDDAALERAIHEHIAGTRNNGFLLYKLMNLALWRRFYLCCN